MKRVHRVKIDFEPPTYLSNVWWWSFSAKHPGWTTINAVPYVMQRSNAWEEIPGDIGRYLG